MCAIMRAMSKRTAIVFGLILALALCAAFLVHSNQETRQLTGIVMDATTHLPVPDAQVSVAEYRTLTDAQGQYAIEIRRGTATLAAQADGYDAAQTPLNGDDLFARAFSIDFALQPNRVAVIVRDLETSQPLPNVPVMVGDKLMTANAQGALEARAVKTGTPFVVQLPGYQPIAVAYDAQGDFDLLLAPTQVSVLVTNKYTNQPIAHAQIQADAQTIASDAQGRAVLRRVKPGATVRAAAPGFESASAPISGGTLQLVLRPNTLDGSVTDAATGQPISGTLIYLGSTIVATDAKGAYHLDNVPAKAAVTLKAPGYAKPDIDVSGVTRRDVKLTPFLAKGIHIPFGIPAERVRELMDLVGKTELNAIVIDVKSEKGRLAWDSQVPLAKQIGAAYLRGIDLIEVIERCKTQNIYCIARLPVFQDNLLASSRPNQAVRAASGAVFTENGGQQWLNPYLAENSNYALALAQQVVALGFDEIQFDYIRFPGRVNGLDFGTENTEEKRIAAIAGFLARAQKELRPTGVFISADVFGLTTATDDDQHTGQRLRDLGPYVDYISPMVYPDTWVEATDLLTKGLGLRNCVEAVRCPYDVIYSSYKRAAEKTSTKVRLWLQAYVGRGDFGVAQYRLQKKAAMEAGSYGWMFWNGHGTYDPKTFDAK